ncbi:involucrin repeat protein [Metarhizium album ARSEF 1941]|uniref:Involucrin repeat protein n=1 Tax=Metarhizium album (strain ARSEF 1941) TaxID=1081103 RepID=A0A0B2WNR0_METAS|nr:involucrin repeat protein [Metarhizium album ARSEF 1941]KHN95264.1 involucrin repeat protein [Metarhizium album ARSEF 1941]
MMRDFRRQSPESSRRRRRDYRRSSRDNLAFVPPHLMDSNMHSSSTYPDYATQHPTPSATTTARARGAGPHDADKERDGIRDRLGDETRETRETRDGNRRRGRDEVRDGDRYGARDGHVGNGNRGRDRDRHQEQIWEQQYAGRQRTSSDSSGSFSSSSAASSLLDISRRYSNQSRFGGILATFFKAPSERRVRRRRSGRAKQRRVLYFGNSSSSSVNSDLAYGTGYIPKTKSSEFNKLRKVSGASSAQHTRDGDGRDPNERDGAAAASTASAAAGSSGRYGASKRDKTDEEILSLGRQLSDFAKKHGQHDPRSSGKTKAPGFAAAAAAVNEVRHRRRDTKTRGIATSTPRRDYSNSSDDSDWEDASDDESDLSDAESALAYGSVASHILRPTRSGMISAKGAATGAALGAGAPSTAGRSGTSTRPAESLPATNVRKSSVVDPRLFGPYNSLRGMINTPCGFGEGQGQPPADHRQFNKLRRAETEPIHNEPMRNVYPMPTSDPNKFDAEAASNMSSRQDIPYRSRPAPIPLQQPSPKAPVSSKVYEADKLEEEGQKHSRTRSDETGVGAGMKLTGLAAAAAAAAALASDRKSKRESRRDERRKERKDDDSKIQEAKGPNRVGDPWHGSRDDSSKRRDKDAESETSRRSKRDSHSSKYPDERDHKRHSRHDDDANSRKRREIRVDHYPEAESSRKSKHSDKGDPDGDVKNEASRSSRRESRNFDDPDERGRERDEKSILRQTPGVYDYTIPPATATRQFVDPFQFQVTDGTLETSLIAAATAPARPLTPTVVTVDREPIFDEPPSLAQSDNRLSRKDSFEMERVAEEYKKSARDCPQDTYTRRHDDDEREHGARTIHDEAIHFTAPIAAAAVESAVAVEMDRSRDHRHNDYVDDGLRKYSTPSKDPVQQEADRYYRERMAAEKIAAEEQKSSSAPYDKSVIGKYDGSGQEQSYTIVTPPDMEENRTHSKSLYEGPDADVRIDNKIYPQELHRFQSRDRASNSFSSRDPSCERERPMLNLVYPTPIPSRQSTPSLARGSSEVGEKSTSAERDKDKKKTSEENKSMSNDGSAGDYFGGAKSDAGASAAASTLSSSAKSVTWGENSTKKFEVESPGPRSEDEIAHGKSESGEKHRPLISQMSQWGMIAAAIAGSSAEPADEPKVKGSRSKKASSDVDVDYRGRLMRHEDDLMDDARSEPPIPGPKPVGPTSVKMPGGFADDVEFAATLAAGLEDAGFDPKIVIDDPKYSRRDSPPHTSDNNGDGWNGSSFADVASDMTSKQKRVSDDPGFYSEPVDMPRECPTGGPTHEWPEAPDELSKKERKRIEKKAKTKSVDSADPASAEAPQTGVFEDASKSRSSKKERRKRDKEAGAEDGEHFDQTLDKKHLAKEDDCNSREAVTDLAREESDKKKSRKGRRSRDFEDDTSSKVSRTDSFDDRSTIRVVDPDDVWDAPKKSKSRSKSKTGSASSDIIARSAPGSEVGDRETRSKRSSRSAPGSEVGVREGSSKDTSGRKSKRRSGIDFDNYGDEPPGRNRDPWDDRDVGSVISEPRGDDRRKERRSKPSSLYDNDDTKSVASAPGSSRKSKKSSPYEYEDAARSTISLSGSSRRSRDKETDKGEKRSSGLFASIFKKDSKDESKKLNEESFLDNAVTLGAGVGLATAAAAAAASVSRSNAAEASSSEKVSDAVDADRHQKSDGLEDIDPDIAPRAIKPAIDPQYGDLLPLPPSKPGSPKPLLEDLPGLPDSRPDTPPEERALKRDLLTHRRRRSTQDTPAKSPSSTAIPISLRLGQRHAGPPSSAVTNRSPPSDSPVMMPEPSRRSARISWDSSREFMPLYLLEHSRHGSVDDVPQMDLPELPPSEPSEPPSGESPAPRHADLCTDEDVTSRKIRADNLAAPGLQIDTELASSAPVEDITGSQETTPRATAWPKLPRSPTDQQTAEVTTASDDDPAPVDSMSKDRSSYLLNSAPSSTKSSKTVKSEHSMHSPLESTPTKHHLTTETSLPNVPEDLTSSDEHFSDALEGTHSETFEEARDWFDDVPPPGQVATQMSLPLAKSAVEPTPSAPVGDTEPDERKGMSAKERRKAKKAVLSPLLKDELTKMEETGESIMLQDDFQQSEIGKKAKKKIQKSFSLEKSYGETPTQPVADNIVSVAVADIPDINPAKHHAIATGEIDNPEQNLQDSALNVTDDAKEEVLLQTVDATIHDADKHLVQDSAPEAILKPAQDATTPNPTAEADSWEAPSETGKMEEIEPKNVSSRDIEPAAEATSIEKSSDLGADVALEKAESAVAAVSSKQPEVEGTNTEPLALNMSVPPETTTEPTASPETGVVEESHDTTTPPGEQSTTADPEGMAFAPLSKKDNRKDLQMEEPVLTELEPETVTLRHPEQLEESRTEPTTEFAMEKVDVPDGEDTTAEDPRTLSSFAKSAASGFGHVSSDGETTKDGQHLDEPLPVETILDASLTVHNQSPSVETMADQIRMTEACAARDSTSASQEPVESVEATESEYAPASKDKKRKKKGRQSDKTPPGDKESETPLIVKEELVIGLPRVEDTASAAQDSAVPAEAGEDEFAPAKKSQKKKKKGKSAQSEEPLKADKELDASATPGEPAVTEELGVPVAEQTAVSDRSAAIDEPAAAADNRPSTTILSDQTITEEPSSADEPVSLPKEPSEAAESEFAPVSSKDKRKKKKNKRQPGDSAEVDITPEVLTVSEDQLELAKSEVDLAADTDAAVTEADPDPNPQSIVSSGDSALVMKGKKKKKKDKRMPTQSEEPLSDPNPQLVHVVPAAQISDETAILEQSTTNRDGEVQVPLEEQPQPWATQVSAPLSEGKIPLDSTQDGTAGVEPTQTEGKAVEEKALEGAETPLVETETCKKKGKKRKKNKKNNQGNDLELLEEKPTEDTALDPGSTSAETESVEKAQEGPVAAVATEIPRDLPEERTVEMDMSQAEDEWSTTVAVKTSKQEKEDISKSPSAREASPTTNTSAIKVTEAPSFTEGLGSFKEMTAEPVPDSERSNMKAEPLENDSIAETSALTSAPPDITVDRTGPAADPEAEFVVPAKDEKDEEKENTFFPRLAEAEPGTAVDSTTQDAKQAITDNVVMSVTPAIGSEEQTADREAVGTANTNEQPLSENKPIDIDPLGNAALCEAPKGILSSEGDATETSPVENADDSVHAELPKKDKKKKKKKKKQADLQQTSQGHEPQLIAEPKAMEPEASLNVAHPAVTSNDGPAPTAETSMETTITVQTKETEANTEDICVGLSSKQSDGDNNGRKTKDGGPELITQRTQADPSMDLTREPIQEHLSKDSAAAEKGFETTRSAVESETPGGLGPANDEKVAKDQEEHGEAKDNDEWAAGKKEKALGMDADVSSRTAEETSVSEEPATTKTEEVGGHDTWTGMVSKKEKKKKNKKAKQGSQYDDLPPQSTPIQDVDNPYDADARPEAENDDPLEPATTAQNIGDTEISDAVPRDVLPESHQANAVAQAEPREPKEPKNISMPPDSQPPRSSLDIAESSAPINLQDCSTVQVASAQPSGDPDVPVATGEPADDEWPMPISGKKVKKGKKNLKSQVDSMPPDDPAVGLSSPPTEDKSVLEGGAVSFEAVQCTIPDDKGHCSTTEKTADIVTNAEQQAEATELVTRNIGVYDTQAMVDSPPALSTLATQRLSDGDEAKGSGAEDFWQSTPQKTLSKKEKKREQEQQQQQQQPNFADQPEDKAQEVLYGGDNKPGEMVDPVAAASNGSVESPVIAEPITTKPEEWLPSKYDEKKAATAALGAAAPAAAGVTGTMVTLKEEHDQPVAAQKPTQYGESRSWADEMEDEAAVTPAEQEPVVIKTRKEADDVGPVTSHKAKKGKKGKSRGSPPDNYPTPEPIPATETFPETPAEAVPEGIPETAAPTVEQAPVTQKAIDAENESRVAISKRKTKKGKKNKSGSETIASAESALASEDTMLESTRTIPQAFNESAASPDPAEDDIASKKSGATVNEAAGNEWAMSSKKKGKKGKKSKSGSGSMTPITPLEDFTIEITRSEATAAAEDPATSTVAGITEARQGAKEDDEWAMPTKKEGKGKKSGSMSLSAFDEPLVTKLEAEAGTGGYRDLSAMDVDATSAGKADDEMTTVTEEARPDETGAVPAAKKVKKGEKKGKQSQAAVLDSSRNDIVVEQQDPSFDVAETQPEEAADDEWTDDFPVPKSKKKMAKKAAAGVPAESATEKKAVESFEETAAKVAPTDETDDRPSGEAIMTRDVGELVRDGGAKSQSSLSAPATAGAITGGVALLTEKFGGGKKKTKGKQKKIVDQKRPQDDDMFDDSALWEGADKKTLESGKDAELEYFWGGAADENDRRTGGGEMEKDVSKDEGVLGTTNTREVKHVLPRTMSGSLTESEGGWTEAVQHGVPLNDDFAESVLGRGEAAAPTAWREPAGLLRRSAGVGEPAGGLLKERSESEPALLRMGPEPDSRRSPSGVLPAVQEVPEAEAIAAQYNWPTPEMKRDSGLAPESPTRQPRRSLGLTEDQQRDSGVHTDDCGDGKMDAPGVSTEKRLPHPPFATPVLPEPKAAVATPEPEKGEKTRSAAAAKTKDYGEVVSTGGVAAGVAGRSTTEVDAAGRRSVSDSPHMYAPGSAPSSSSSFAKGSDGCGEDDAAARAEPVARRSVSSSSLSRRRTPEPLKLRPETPGIQGIQGIQGLQGLRRSTPTPPLRRVDKRMSGDLRALRQRRNSSSTSSTATPPAPTPAAAIATAADSQVLPPPVANESRVRSRGEEKSMADVYDGYGEGRIGSPRSPTRPHSMRRRQSMQVLELESRVEQLVAENRMLTEARTHAEQSLSQKAAGLVSERDSEIQSLKQSLHFLQREVARLTEVNEGLTSANAELASKDSGRHADVTRELDEARGAHTALTQSLQDKDAEIADLRARLEEAKEQMCQMQRRILESKAGDSSFLNIKDEDYFDRRCQQLCSHVQQWVLRFSKFSDMRACRLTSEINDEKTVDRLDNAVLDGTDVDTYLRDRIKRRDIFMSMSMNMIWEFVFTRYLFGMDREQRQKLKSLERLLTEVGPVQAVRQWRAVTLTLLSKRASFKDQRDLDTEAVVQAIYQTLCKILPPPSNLEGQIQSQLRRVLHEAVDLSVEMRTQRAEYMMLPPLQPEYDADGELAATVSFDAAMMNERSGTTSMTNEELEAQGSVVRVVLFPLVVKRGDDDGNGDDKIVVCPAQVLIARDDRIRRHYAPSSEAGGASLGARSRISVVTESMGLGQSEA